MKRKRDLYKEIYKFENIKNAFDEVCRNTKNKRKVAKFKEYKCIYISRIYNILQTKSYIPSPYIFLPFLKFLYNYYPVY